ncbi:Por secretion system C-terminal sorting domain-containing protein [Polaribacter sp. Hel1_33_78]|uniref:Ig-like domain-containing protein n=1 Tax=Polaribacter sp. Hel1_33_78 TaxID=1336804 RepID=UPI00087DDBC7|nr:Ig-like domain-containing protein [Polaribacter sp. Hel1_33_78]SDT89521.1 Por secretion system C-terminal sorting domain-containing protein [Polaribacter sp. Hel1_33_78]
MNKKINFVFLDDLLNKHLLSVLFVTLLSLKSFAQTNTVTYFEDFDSSGIPTDLPANGYWTFHNEIDPTQTSWEDFIPGDGFAYITVDANTSNDNDPNGIYPFQTLEFGGVGENHRLEVRMKGAVVDGGLVSFLFTYKQEGSIFNEVDLELVADDAATASHNTLPSDGGWTEARFNTWRNANENTSVPFTGTKKAVVNQQNEKISLIDGEFHTYAIDWRSDRIDFFIDDILQESINTDVATGVSEVIIGFRDLPWAGDFNWSGTHTLEVDYLKIEPLEPATVAQNDSFTVNEDTESDLDVLANDVANATITSYDAFSAEGYPVSQTASILTYIPSGGFVGIDSFTYSIEDENGDSSTATVTVTIEPVESVNGVPYAKADAITVAQNTTTILDVLADNGSEADYFGTDGAFDNGLTLFDGTLSGVSEQGTITVDTKSTDSPLDDRIIYTPNNGFIGVDHFYYSITDASGDTAIAQVTITVTEINTPTAQDDAATVAHGVTIPIDVLSNDSFGLDGQATNDALTINVATNINGATIAVNAGKIDYTPASNYIGIDIFTYIITDGSGDTTTADVTITVTGAAVVDEPNVLSAKRDEVSVAQNSTDNEIAVLLDNGFDIDSFGLDGAIDNGLTFLDGTLTGLSEQGTIIVDTNSSDSPLDDVIVYTPNTGFVGVDHFYYMITDTTGASSIAQVAITVTEIDTPTAQEDEVSVLQDSGVTSIAVLSNDSFGSDGRNETKFLEIDLSYSSANLASGIVVNGDNVDYTAADGFTGQETFRYTIYDFDGQSKSAIVTITVGALSTNDSPKAQDDAVIFAQDSSENIINILDDNGSGADNYGLGAAHPSHPISLVAFYSKEGGALELDGTTVKYTPRTGYVGEDTFDYLITDENGVSDRATVTINVTGSVANGLTAVADEVAAVEGVTRTINVLANDVFGTAFLETVVISNESGEVTITVNSDNTLEYTYTVAPGATFTGTTDTFNYTIIDASTANESTATVTVTIQAADAVNGVPEAKGDELEAVQNTISKLFVLADNGFGPDEFGTDGPHSAPLSFINGLSSGKSVKQIESDEASVNNLEVKVDAGVFYIEYTPVAGFTGEDSFYYMITDASGDNSLAQVFVTVTEIDTPTAQEDEVSVLQDSGVTSIAVLSNDSFGSDGRNETKFLEIDLSYSSANLASGIVVNGDNVDYTAADGFTGQETFRYTIYDFDGQSKSAIVTITVGALSTNDSPKAQDDAVIFAQDSSENIINILDDNGSGADNYGLGAAHPSHPISLVAFYSKEGGALELDGTTVKYTPRTGYVGEDTFDYLITDENGVSDRATVTINVTGSVANGLTAVADEVAAVEGVTRTINVLANDVFGTAFLEAVVITNESNEVTITVNSDNTLEYTYTVAPGATFTGTTDTFNYTIKEDGTTNESTTTVTVTIQAADAVNGVPEAKGDTFSVVQGIMSSLAVLADNGSGVDNFGSDGENTTNPLRLFNGTTEGKSVKQIEREAQGSSAFNNLVVNSGKIEYTPVAAFIGEDSFYYKIVDASGDESIAQVTINVTSSKSSGIVTTDAVIKDLQVYPNPSKGAFKVLVYSEKAEQASVLLFDVTGKVVYNKKQLLSAGNNTMNLHVNVQTGILFLKVYTDNTNFGTKKILFE